MCVFEDYNGIVFRDYFNISYKKLLVFSISLLRY